MPHKIYCMTATTPNYGMGRRKTARAQIILTTDSRDQKINGVDLNIYFPTISMQQSALLALKLTSQSDEFGLQGKVSGGGKHSQADAVKLAVARALITVDKGFQKQLRDAGLLTRDSRMKERKKPGLKRARRAPQFSKR